jgi:hypothetical protein
MEVYVFGDANIIPRLKNAAVDLYLAKHRIFSFYNGDLKYLYGHTTSGDALRKLVVDYAVEKYSWLNIDKARGLYPLDFFC